MQAYFGERWDAPAFDDAIERPTPVGEVCELGCGEPIAEGDSGTWMPFADRDAPRMIPMHIECWLRMTLGCLSHLEGRCSCFGGTGHDGFSRQAARDVMDYWRRRMAAARN